MITVRELLEVLNKVEDKDRVVIVAKDGEGNSYSPLRELEADNTCIYRPDSTWSGEIYDDGDPDYEAEKKDQQAFLLRPIN